MRTGFLEVQLVPESGRMSETPTGHVVALVNQVYKIKLTNHNSRRALVQVKIDGRLVTEHGLVINGFQTVFLERPIHTVERGRFTVFAEGQTEVFGEDGGRDNKDLGVIEVTHQLEQETPKVTFTPYPIYRPFAPYNPWYPWYNGPYNPNGVILDNNDNRNIGAVYASNSVLRSAKCSFTSDQNRVCETAADISASTAAGTGLTGKSDQNFIPVHMGALESAITTIILRLILEAPVDWAKPRPLPGAVVAPVRPPARA